MSSHLAPPRRIVILGGGSAGWMSAAALATGLRGAEVTLVESEVIGTIGVGEATFPSIRNFNQLLGIDEAAFLAATGGSYKLGIQFCDWRRPGEHYFHTFGDFGPLSGPMALWGQYRRLDARCDGGLGDFCLPTVMARHGRFRLPDAGDGLGAPVHRRTVDDACAGGHREAGADRGDARAGEVACNPQRERPPPAAQFQDVLPIGPRFDPGPHTREESGGVEGVDGGQHPLRTVRAGDRAAERPGDGIRQRFGRDGGLIGSCCLGHHWSGLLGCFPGWGQRWGQSLGGLAHGRLLQCQGCSPYGGGIAALARSLQCPGGFEHSLVMGTHDGNGLSPLLRFALEHGVDGGTECIPKPLFGAPIQ